MNMNDTMLSGLIVGLLALFLFTPYMYAKGIAKLEKEDLTVGDKLLCFIPIFNTVRAEYKYTGKIGFHTISLFVMLCTTIARVYQWRFHYSNTTAGLICMALFWIGIALFIISNCVLVYMVIHDFDVVSGFKLILLSLFYPFGQYYVGAYLSNTIRHMKSQEETFKQ